jgi:hypothetical protein
LGRGDSVRCSWFFQIKYQDFLCIEAFGSGLLAGNLTAAPGALIGPGVGILTSNSDSSNSNDASGGDEGCYDEDGCPIE